jgi:hypothetical protein
LAKKLNKKIMRKIILHIIIWSAGIFSANAQAPQCNTEQDCENGNGISTNPNNPINTKCPERRNNFDWRVQRTDGYPEDYIIYGPNTTYKEIQNPFTGPSGASHVGTLVNQTNSDYQPEDGWELLKVEFGIEGNTNINNTQNYQPNQPHDYTKPRMPYMILYNKYSGTMRFFGALLNANSDYETLEIQLRIPSESPKESEFGVYVKQLKATNLLSLTRDFAQPLDIETNDVATSMFIKFRNNENEFFWFDLPVAYDPCICNNKVQLDIFFNFVQTANIKINNEDNSAVKTETKSTSSGNLEYGKIVVGRVFAAAASAVIAVKSGGTIINFQAFTDLIDIVTEHKNFSPENNENLLKLKNYLDCGSKYASVITKNKGYFKNFDFTDEDAFGNLKGTEIKAGNEILEANTTFLSSLTKGCNQKDNASTVNSGSIHLSGEWTRDILLGGTEKHLAVPGSNWNDKTLIKIHNPADSLYPAYTTYDERLGTFSLLESPMVKLEYLESVSILDPTNIDHPTPTITKSGQTVFKMYLDDQLKYSFNPILNLDYSNTTIQARLVVKKHLGDLFPYNVNEATNFTMSVSANQKTSQGMNPLCSWSETFNFSNINCSVSKNNFFEVVTPYVPIDQIRGVKSVFSQSFLSSSYDLMMENIFIQFQIVGISKNLGTDGFPVSFVQYFTFPVKVQLIPNLELYTLAKNPLIESCSNMRTRLDNQYPDIINSQFNSSIIHRLTSNQSKIFNSDINFLNDETFFYDGFVKISAKLSTTAGKKVKIYSTFGFELLPGAEIDPSIELIVGYPFASTPNPPQTYQQVSDFCSDTIKYKAQEHSAAAIAEEKAVYEEHERARILAKMQQDRSFKFGLKPNPTSGMSTVFWDGDEMPNQLTLIDGAGQVLFDTPLSGDGRSYDLDMSAYSHGVYLIIITSSSGKKGQQKLIKL